MGLDAAISALRGWHPDVIYAHGFADPAVEARTLEAAPAVLFAHNYYGTCISGAKTFKYPVVRSCARRFGWQCLIHFYPRRCGGLSPLTMLTDFRRQSQRLELLHSYQAIITASKHMRAEYLRHGLAAEAVKVIPLPAESAGNDHLASDARVSEPGCNRHALEPCRLLFVGRMESPKGGDLLLDALPFVLRAIGRPTEMTLVGDGTERRKWEETAARLQSEQPRLRVRFTGWLERDRLQRLYRESDLLVVPSRWPEPFGLVGPEAGLQSLPAVAFAVGGIQEWLIDGVNGYLASADPPTAEGLAQAVVKCLGNPGMHKRLRRGALQIARQFSLANHMGQLIRLFEKVVGSDGSPQAEAAR